MILWDWAAVILPHDEAGSGPAVVLIHAGIADRTMWSEYVERLADAGYRAVAVDLPGFGEARVASGEQAPWADVLRTMDGLAIVRAALVGSSFGGAVALRAALVAPDRVSALALISAPPPALEPSPELKAAWEAEEAALQRGDIEAAVEAVVHAWTLPDASPELRERVAAMQRRAFALQAEAPPTTEAPDPVEQRPDALARLSVPTLVAAGELDKRDFRQGAEAMARALPRARHAVIEGAGHLPPLETPETFWELMLACL
ncbi:Pimeloyl-ACP methyl ester carboxylesterase [Geodermatophilus africanus]|uniref:Pimeloyl-ACP methyl ester carboxylesterase n=1 Tax=Geodermatophilus africanus TaxID=1137993 RepID=A0A1H3EFE6_9ACTN|nr:alpha/beta fold hydrolase [Geodermatophilus africanus]SDX77463.1 Pimeloyl-ACP methyl ester carboxylesterase [Geodermatophilus africanus]